MENREMESAGPQMRGADARRRSRMDRCAHGPMRAWTDARSGGSITAQF